MIIWFTNTGFQFVDESSNAWLDVMELTMTTLLPPSTLNRTFFNLANRPSCLAMSPPVSTWDFRSYHYALVSMLTTLELDRIDQGMGELTEWNSRPGEKISYLVILTTKPIRHSKPKVDVFITLTGMVLCFHQIRVILLDAC